MRIKEASGGALAVGAQHLEEVIVGVESVGGVECLRCARERNPMHIDAPILPRTGTARQPALVDQLADKSKAAQFRHQRGIESDLVDARQDLRSEEHTSELKSLRHI